MKKEINDIIKVSILADQLLQGVKVVEWMNSPNEHIFNDTPVEICLRGDGDILIEYLERILP